MTLAAAHFERGDVAHAVRLCHRAIEQAERLDSPQAKASAYWNASVMESNQGAVEAAVVAGPEGHSRCSSWGTTPATWPGCASQLGRQPAPARPAAVEDAQANLEQAANASWPGRARARPTPRATGSRLARARYLAGDLADAAERAAQIIAASGTVPPHGGRRRDDSHGQIAADEGDVDRARQSYREAILALTGIGADRNAAQLWFELGGLLEEIGAADEAMDAYRRAAASTGLTVRRTARTPA